MGSEAPGATVACTLKPEAAAAAAAPIEGGGGGRDEALGGGGELIWRPGPSRLPLASS